MKKIKAFTLIELVIGMIVGSIVMGICYSAYFMISTQFSDYRLKRNEIGTMIQFNTILSNDFVNSQTAYFFDAKVMLITKEYDIEYEFIDTCIFRKIGFVVDTFNISTSEMSANYYSEQKKDLIDGFTFNMDVFDKKYTLHYSKKYSAETLIN